MKFFVSTACLPGSEPIAQRLAALISVGLDHVELGAGLRMPEHGFRPADLPSGMEYLLHNYFPPPPVPFVLNLASMDSSIRERSLELIENGLRFSSELGAPFFSIHGGFITDATSFNKDSFIFPAPLSAAEEDRAMARYLTGMEHILEKAETYKVVVLVENNVCTLENKGKLLLQRADEFTFLFDRLRSPYLGMLIDTGHMNVSAVTWGFDRMDFVRTVEPWVRAFHLHDNDGSADQHHPVQQGSWVLEAISRPAFCDATVILESKAPSTEALREQVDLIRTGLPATYTGSH